MIEALFILLARFLANSPGLVEWLQRRALKTPYFHIRNQGSLYMCRWWLMPRWCLRHDPDVGALVPKAWMPFSVRLHHIVRPDEDRHLHDHPFKFRSMLLQGWYVEQDVTGAMATREAGDTYRSAAERFHRIDEISPGGVWSIFIMGRKTQNWGFLVGSRKVAWQTYLGGKT